MHCRALSSLPGLYALAANSSLPPTRKPRCIQNLPSGPWQVALPSWRTSRPSLCSQGLFLFFNYSLVEEFWLFITRLFVCFFLFYKRSIYLLEWQSQREREINLLFSKSIPIWLQWPVLAKPKPGTWKSIWVSHMGGRDSSPWAIICCFHRHISRELDRKWNH